MEKKFTNGKWEQSEVTPQWIVTTRSQGGDICKISGHGGNSEMTDTDLANAKLIAAAPELYEALKDLWQHYENHGQILTWDVSKAKAALNKAI